MTFSTALRATFVAVGTIASLMCTACAPTQSDTASPIESKTQMPAVVSLQQGQYQGDVRDGYERFLGIRYAAPVDGENRWKAPQPVIPHEGVVIAKTFAPDCKQEPFVIDMAPLRTITEEDCLYLNVWRPKDTDPEAKLPVIAWIHGGGFVNGGSSPHVYDGASFAKNGVIYVSFNYRLGRFGFFAHPELENGGSNFAYLDQVAALKWIKANIQSYGGDASNVTIFGESAGGKSVLMHLTQPMSAGTFDKAIVQSGLGGNSEMDHFATLELAQAKSANFAKSVGLEQTASLNELKALSADKIVSGMNLGASQPESYSGPFIDGVSLVENTYDVFARGDQVTVPFIIGANALDGFPWSDNKELIFASYGDTSSQARALLDPDGTKDAVFISMQVFSDSFMVGPARSMARMAYDNQNVWLYRFSHVPKAKADEWQGAVHASEIPYVMNTVKFTDYGRSAREADLLTASIMHPFWVNFAKTSLPAADEIWPKVASDKETKVMMIGNGEATFIEDPITARLDLVTKN